MNAHQMSGVVIAAGLFFYVAAMFVAPRLYDTEDISERLHLIEENQARWNISQLFFALGPGVTAAGIAMLAFLQRSGTSAWLYGLGAALFAIGSGIAVWLVYRQTMDPAAFWEGTETPLIIGYGFLLLSLAGMICLGIAILQSSFPNWVGYFAIGSAVVLAIASLASRGQAGFFISIFIYLVTFVMGVVIWRF